ncbi:MAG: carboxymuconolactone decarboxylase family protein [Candidatus Microthrix parvicella]|uniref:carboxymuconolactone decarboxylase family protein n=1 Tax=Candidatus Neomicrothrix TaxID=41949 RepID=UPI0004B51E28|nr:MULTISPECIES: carboxymuconolactone decarboxylase family protein [Microthrix]NLH64845.1 carboxymuconolactone decarboxylase family protein [Candidatus Microthrix parvicella]MBK7018487.1 carboxymuconolactone decarboxylase family protein [Candidatus Microthrix sp.]MBK7322047.1 carboxymuconolactone decarboxylase family protein [Candidatus Microthrix sp.]MBP6151820.1 carboxymuconolactone decarboxylase family protein [Candidatus Microthrix sp.]MBP7854266.1 carboxymuconolactone decarboxylase family
MTQVELLDPTTAPLLVEDLFAGGDPGPIAAAFAQVPELALVALPFLGASLGAGSTGARVKELAILRTSAVLACRYCVAAHTTVALDVGLTDAEVRGLRGEVQWADEFDDPAELALLAWIDEVAGGRGAVSAAVTEAAKAHFEDYELVELTNTIGVTMLLNRFCSALKLPVGDDTLARLASGGFEVDL